MALRVQLSFKVDWKQKKMFGIKFFHFLVLLLVCVALRREESVDSSEGNNRSGRQVRPDFHEVDAFGDDFVDFGAQTGPHGQFSWHADFPLEWWKRWKAILIHQLRVIANVYSAPIKAKLFISPPIAYQIKFFAPMLFLFVNQKIRTRKVSWTSRTSSCVVLQIEFVENWTRETMK